MMTEKIFDGADARGSHGNAASGGSKEGALRGGGEFVELAMDGVLFDGFGHDRLKRTESDMQRDVGGVDAGCGELREKFGREMEARGRCRDGDLAGAVSVNGLVAFEIVGASGDDLGFVARDVRWKRDFAKAIGERGDGFAGGNRETHERAAFGILLQDLAGEIVAMREGRAYRKFLSGANETPPNGVSARGLRAYQETFDGAAGGTLGVQACGEDGGVVAKERVSGAEEFGEVAENMVRDGLAGAIDDEEARSVAAGGRRLRDEAGGQVVVEERGRKRHGSRAGEREKSAETERI